MNTTVKYNLSTAGQKAALIAGRTAAATVTEVMSFEDAGLIDAMKIDGAGSLSLDTAQSLYGAGYGGRTLYLDAPPVDVADLVARWVAFRTGVEAEKANAEAEARQRSEAAAEQARIKAAADFPVVEGILVALEAEPTASIKDLGLASCSFYGIATTAGGYLTVTPEQHARLKAVITRRDQIEEDQKKAAAAAKAKVLQDEVDQHGGYVFPVQGGMATFLERGLWLGGQSKRWVGTFSKARSVDKFLEAPRGEFSFNVMGLSAGDLVQGGGYDTNSKGKRRNESEWFGRVVSVSADQIVVRVYDSRTEAMASKTKEVAS